MCQKSFHLLHFLKTRDFSARLQELFDWPFLSWGSGTSVLVKNWLLWEQGMCYCGYLCCSQAVCRCSEVFTEVLNLIGVWSSILHHKNWVLTVHSSYYLKTVGTPQYVEVVAVWWGGSATTPRGNGKQAWWKYFLFLNEVEYWIPVLHSWHTENSYFEIRRFDCLRSAK